jgi:hypothetical protein
MARAARERGLPPAVRHHGIMLDAAVCSLLADIGTNFLGLNDAEPAAVLEALARDHLLENI